MKNTIKLIGIIALATVIGFSFTACGDGGGGGSGSGGNNNPDGNNPGGENPVGGNNGATVYVSGAYFDSNYNGPACYWANGIRTDLPVPNGTDGYATGIAVQGGKVYVSGMYYDSNYNGTACYWVNGTRTDLPVPNGTGGEVWDFTVGGEVWDITVQDGNVYVSGRYYNNDDPEYGLPCYWVNGVRTDLLPVPDGTEGFAYGGAYGTAVQGNTVYVTGAYSYHDYYNSGDRYFTACYWVNGTRTDLPVPNGTEGWASGITVQGNNVYVSGAYNSNDNPYNLTACYWVNGNRTDLPLPNGTGGGAGGIAVQGSNIYVSGCYWNGNNMKACYWVNGTRTDLSGIYANYDLYPDIAVNNGNVYVSGNYLDNNDNSKACYWVDGTRKDLTVPSGTESLATGIAIVTQ
jgi:hypothetical protein